MLTCNTSKMCKQVSWQVRHTWMHDVTFLISHINLLLDHMHWITFGILPKCVRTSWQVKHITYSWMHDMMFPFKEIKPCLCLNRNVKSSYIRLKNSSDVLLQSKVCTLSLTKLSEDR